MKDGIQGKLIDLGKNIETPIPQLMEEILEFVDDVVDPLGSRKEIEYIRTIMKEGTSADRQLQKYKENDSMKEVVDMLIENTMAECN
jgi:carboxylate-amine ligase